MNPARRMGPILVSLLTSPVTRALRRRIAERRRRLGGEPHRVHYFHQVDDPYSHLAAQTLEGILERYDVDLVAHLVGPPPDDAAPEPALLAAYARKDAADVAPAYGLEFPRVGDTPPSDLARRAAALLAGLSGDAFATLAPRVGSALWNDDRGRFEQLEREHTPATEREVESALAEGDARRQRLGHYSGAMLYYGGEWYWGVDRLHHLETRLYEVGAGRRDDDLEDDGGTAAPEPIVAPPKLMPSGAASPDSPHVVECYLSLRSPYSYLAVDRVLALPRRWPVEVRLRPVLPMVMRGLPVPRAKRLYIVLDTKREAERLGIPFGRVADPVGRPVERGFSLYAWARAEEKAGEYLSSFFRAVFAGGIDAGTDEGLRRIVEAAGLTWSQAERNVDEDGWRAELEDNRKAMFDFGLWGVPSFRLVGREGEPDFFTWGQDRIWLLESEIARRNGDEA